MNGCVESLFCDGLLTVVRSFELIDISPKFKEVCVRAKS